MFLLWFFCSSAWLLALINVVPGDILMFLCNFFIMVAVSGHKRDGLPGSPLRGEREIPQQ